MQYLLTEQELRDLVPRHEITKREAALLLAREAILKANNFRCVHEKGGGYCDNCPCSPKGTGSDRALWNIICRDPKTYSK